LSAKPRRGQGILRMLDALSTISSRSSVPVQSPTMHGHAPYGHRRFPEQPRLPRVPVLTTQPVRPPLQTHQKSIVMPDPKFDDPGLDAQKGRPSHPPNPGAPRRASPQARPQPAKGRGGTYRTSCEPAAHRAKPLRIDAAGEILL
jgi:hypothetical protein